MVAPKYLWRSPRDPLTERHNQGAMPVSRTKKPVSRTKKIATVVGCLGLAAGLGFATAGVARAAHGGALTEGDFSGRAEVNSQATNSRIVGDPNGSGDAYVFSTGGGVVCYVLNVDKIGTATAAHIHEASAGTNGPVVVTLSAPASGSSAGCVDTGDADLAADITLRESADYYVNVHNAEYPGGAVRAQLGS